MKKPLFNLLIVLACVVLLFIGLGMVLIIAPGIKIFDIQYMRKANSLYEQTIKADAVSVYEKIEVNGLSTDINIKFVQAQDLKGYYRQNFSGFTRSKIESPEFFAVEEDNTLKITIREYEPFIYGTQNGETGLTLEVPVYYNGKIDITANNSNVSFSGLVGNIDTISVNTKNSVVFNDGLTVNNLKLTVVNKKVELGEKVNVNGSIDMTSKNASLIVANPIGGDLNFNSTSGSVTVSDINGKCNVNTKNGKLTSYTEAKATIGGDADIFASGGVDLFTIKGEGKIETKGGKVYIGATDKVAENKKLDITTKSGQITFSGEIASDEINITTKSGAIEAEKLNKLNVSSSSGKINISNVNFAHIDTESSEVNILTVNEKAEVKTKSGKVRLSSIDGGIVANADVTTVKGEVNIYHPTEGIYNISTRNGKVNFFGDKDYSSELNVIAEKRSDVNATNISGKTYIKTEGKVNIEVLSMNAPINIEGRDKSVDILLSADLYPYYNLNSEKKNVSVVGTDSNTKSYITTAEGRENDTITVSTRWGVITVSRKSI